MPSASTDCAGFFGAFDQVEGALGEGLTVGLGWMRAWRDLWTFDGANLRPTDGVSEEVEGIKH